jgi:hypothetical protein
MLARRDGLAHGIVPFKHRAYLAGQRRAGGHGLLIAT